MQGWRIQTYARCPDGQKVAAILPMSEDMADEVQDEKSGRAAELAKRLWHVMSETAATRKTAPVEILSFKLVEVLEDVHTVTQDDLDNDADGDLDGFEVGDTWADDVVLFSVDLPIPEGYRAKPNPPQIHRLAENRP